MVHIRFIVDEYCYCGLSFDKCFLSILYQSFTIPEDDDIYGIKYVSENELKFVIRIRKWF